MSPIKWTERNAVMQELYITSEVGPIHCCQWMPLGEPIGVIQIIHGVKEHIGRYGHLAEFLTQNGYLVLGVDHPGHGLSVIEEDGLGYLSGGWKQDVRNIRALFTQTHMEYAKIPYMMLGHSMGSFLLMTYLSVFSRDLGAAILSGSGRQADAMLTAGRLLCQQQAAKLGEKRSGPVIESLMFSSYNKHFAPTRTPHDWLSTKLEVAGVCGADPLCGWPVSIQLCSEMMRPIQ